MIKKKYAALMIAAAVMAVPGTLAMAASPNTNVNVSHSSSSSSSGGRSSKSAAGLNVDNGTITNKTVTGVKNNGQNGSNGITVRTSTTTTEGGSEKSYSVGFASDQQIKDNNNWCVAEKVFEINAGVQLYRVTGDPAMVGYSPLMPAQQLMATDATGAVTKEKVTVNIELAALGNAQNVQLYYYDETTHAWELAAVNGVDYATNTVNVTMPGNAVFTLVHKN